MFSVVVNPGFQASENATVRTVSLFYQYYYLVVSTSYGDACVKVLSVM
jgi:hypothetical protein